MTSARRLGVLSDVPTLGQFLPGCDADDWKGIGAPKNTPPEIIDMLNEEINAALADPKFKARLVYLGGVPMSMTAAEFGKFVRNGKMGQGNPRGKHQALARPIRGSIFHIIRSANLSAIDPDTRMSAFPIADMPMASGKFG